MSTELRSPQDTERWLCAGLCLIRHEDLTADALTSAVPWLLATLAESPALPPPAFIADLGRLVAGVPLAPSAPVPDTQPRLRAAVRAYDDHVLARLAAEPHLEAVSAALARLPETLRPRGVAFLVARVLTRMGFTAGSPVSPALARRVLERPPTELLQAGYTALRESGTSAALERLTEGYEALASAARRAHALLGDAESFTLENLEHLQGKAQRMALEQAVEAAEALSRTLPPKLRARPVSTAPLPMALEDEAAFPQGGFSSVSNVGSLENLVTSELVYMEDEPNLDLFDVRYVEGELLYYTRDESISVRRRRVITFVLPPDLVDARVKDAGVRWQRVVVSLGLLLCLVRRLSLWLGSEELHFRAVFLHAHDGAVPLEAERGLCELLLREWRARGTAEVLTAATLDDVLTDAEARAKRARVDLVLLGASSQVETMFHPGASRVERHVLDLSGPSPRVRTIRDKREDLDSRKSEAPMGAALNSDPWEAWVGVTLELAQGLL
ncbi:hypothetical protein [Myxococcus xanthus]|uniref:Uncharacterized protein n=1 Tax=Myxococcus xanthus TaxID=34 RepID=A0A7Y4MW21_MYXXA|nr:hypothetical protein [Myxococcus xanthus]NOJ83293.1 hypothetical protein [Myxococcus xanthus]NOJ89456.1 hypothetical protein [Myxococcus xanthus]